jgi:hypothetical protein
MAKILRSAMSLLACVALAGTLANCDHGSNSANGKEGDGLSPEDQAFIEQAEQAIEDTNAAAASIEQSIKDRQARFDSWVETFTDAVTRAGDFDDPTPLIEIGFIERFDHEAHNVIINHEQWEFLSHIEKGRWLATTVIGDAMFKRSGTHEVTLFSSETGRSLSAVIVTGQTTIRDGEVLERSEIRIFR